jgi:hypothetical protein
MRALCRLLLTLMMVSIPVISSALSTQDIIDLKRAGFSDEIISLMMKPTRSLQAADLIDMKKNGVSDEVIKSMILEDLIEERNAPSSDRRLVTEQIMRLKTAGVSDETVQKMLDREERERARYYGVARTVRHPDGSISIVYGDRSAPFPDTKHVYINTSDYLKYLSLTINDDHTLSPMEKDLWNHILDGLRLRKDID